MRKETKFMWGWKGYEPQPDKSMTRQRAAVLLRAWRRSKTQGQNDFYLKRISKGQYHVAAPGYKDEYATMVIL